MLEQCISNTTHWRRFTKARLAGEVPLGIYDGLSITAFKLKARRVEWAALPRAERARRARVIVAAALVARREGRQQLQPPTFLGWLRGLIVAAFLYIGRLLWGWGRILLWPFMGAPPPPPPPPPPPAPLPRPPLPTAPPPRVPPVRRRYLLRFDGGHRKAKEDVPSTCGAGVVLYDRRPGVLRALRPHAFDSTGADLGVEIWAGAFNLDQSGEEFQPGEARTNNEAEYQGLIRGLRQARRMGITSLDVEGDSSVIVEQVGGFYSVNALNLQGPWFEARTLVKLFSSTSLRWIPRERNAAADEQANIAMDQGRSSYTVFGVTRALG